MALVGRPTRCRSKRFASASARIHRRLSPKIKSAIARRDTPIGRTTPSQRRCVSRLSTSHGERVALTAFVTYTVLTGG
jgi:hypothetical protein